MRQQGKPYEMYLISSKALFHFYFISTSFLFHIYFIPTQLFISLSSQLYFILTKLFLSLVARSISFHGCLAIFHFISA